LPALVLELDLIGEATTMKLSPENLDYMDCRPVKPRTKIRLSERLRKLLGEEDEAAAEACPKDSAAAPKRSEAAG
jgi:hypothetical protein